MGYSFVFTLSLYTHISIISGSNCNFSHLISQRLAVEILVSGFVFDKEDFVRPWEGQDDNLERYRYFYYSSTCLKNLKIKLN